MAPTTSREDRARVGDLEDETDRAQGHEQDRDVRVRDRRTDPLEGGHLDPADRGVAGSERPLGAALLDDAAVEFDEQGLQARGDQIDEASFERLLGRERPALRDRLLGELLVAAAAGRERTGGRRRVLGDLVAHRARDVAAAARHRVGGARVRAGRHRRNVRAEQNEEAG